MGLPWVRLDTQWPHNPKFLQLVEGKKWRSITVYMGALGYAGVHGTDGFIPEVALPMIHATRREPTDLVAVGLWLACAGGWEINGWSEFQPSHEDAKKRREKAQMAAQSRWAKRAQGELHAL